METGDSVLPILSPTCCYSQCFRNCTSKPGFHAGWRAAKHQDGRRRRWVGRAGSRRAARPRACREARRRRAAASWSPRPRGSPTPSGRLTYTVNHSTLCWQLIHRGGSLGTLYKQLSYLRCRDSLPSPRLHSPFYSWHWGRRNFRRPGPLRAVR